MASTLELFQNSVQGSKGTLVDFISIISSKGDFTKITNLDVIIKSWNNILMTPRRTVDHDPEYGSELYRYIYEPADDYTKDKIIEEVTSKIQTYDDRATITSVTVVYLANKKGFNVSVNADYDGEEAELTVPITEQNYISYIS